MASPIFCVFISSTWLDLQPEREALEKVIQRLNEIKFTGMEYFGSRTEDTHQASLDEVDRCQAYVGVFGGRYGSGITEAEYRRARERDLDCFIYFKDEAAIPPEKRETEMEKAGKLAALKTELQKRHTVTSFHNPDDLAAKVTADLHRWLFEEYRKQVYAGEYERLRSAYLPPWPVFERVRLDRFKGREWLTAELDAFLREEDRGCFILEAGAGLGKTTFLAHLVRSRGYTNHFVELTPGMDGVGIGLRNLAAQVVQSWKLNPYSIEGVDPSAATRPDFFQNILLEAARKRDEVQPGEKIVVVVDALDEAGIPSGQNVMGLPRVLPRGTYLIVSQRPVAVPLQIEGPRRVFRLEAEGKENMGDMRAYLESAATWPGVARTLAMPGGAHPEGHPCKVEAFVETLLKKCRGVWIYLHYVVGEIERGERTPLDLESLPNGITQYYARYWQRWRDTEESKWYEVYLPVLATLAAAQEPTPVERLAEWTGVKYPLKQLLRLLNERWRPLLAVVEEKGKPRFRFYHGTLRDFFRGRVDREKLTESEKSLLDELAEATKQAHHCLAERYLTAWGSLEAGLPEFISPSQRDLDEGYGLRHLVTHLEGAGRNRDVHHLLLLETPEKRNAWGEAKESKGDTAGYLGDVERAWRLAEEEFINERPPSAIGLQCRYILIIASLNSLAQNIPSSLLVELVKERVWPPGQGLAYARYLPDPEKRAMALCLLAPHLPEVERKEILTEALTMTRGIEYDWFREKALGDLIPRVAAAGWWEKALEASKQIEDEEFRRRALAGLVFSLPPSERDQILPEVLAAARAMENEGERATILGKLARYLPEEERNLVLAEALSTARAIPVGANRARTLGRLLPHLPEGERNPLLSEAFAAAKGVQDERSRAQALVDLAPHLTEGLLKKALEVAKAITFELDREEALAGLVPRLAALGNCEDALREARAIEWERCRAVAMAGLAPYLPEGERYRVQQEALAAAREESDGRTRVQILTNLAVQLPEGERGQVLNEALATVRAIGDEETRLKFLLELVPCLPGAVLSPAITKALAAARTFPSKKGGSRALALAVSRLAELGHGEEALACARGIDSLGYRARALVGLVPHFREKEGGQVLGEALAAVRSVKEEGVRAALLAELAPRLPEAEQQRVLAEVVSAARAMLPGKAQVQALAGISRYLSQAEKREVLKDTLACARRIPGNKARAEALLDMAEYLPEGERTQVLTEALSAARKVRGNFGAEALVDLALRLPEGQRRSALEEALVTARGMGPYSKDRAWTMARISTQLPETERGEVLAEALSSARRVEDEGFESKMLADLIPLLPESERRAALEAALAAARAVKDQRSRVEVLLAVEPHLPGSERTRALTEALESLGAITDGRSRASALPILAEHLARLPLTRLYAFWRETLRLLASRTRKDLLEDLRHLVPAIAALGGAEAAGETFWATQDVGRWWP